MSLDREPKNPSGSHAFLVKTILPDETPGRESYRQDMATAGNLTFFCINVLLISTAVYFMRKASEHMDDAHTILSGTAETLHKKNINIFFKGQPVRVTFDLPVRMIVDYRREDGRPDRATFLAVERIEYGIIE